MKTTVMKLILISILLSISTIGFSADVGEKSLEQTHDDWLSYLLTFTNGDVLLRTHTTNKNGAMFTIDEIPNDNGTCTEDISVITDKTSGITQDTTDDGFGNIQVFGYNVHKTIFKMNTAGSVNQAFFHITRIEDMKTFIQEAGSGALVTINFVLPDKGAATESFSLMGFVSAMDRANTTCEKFGKIIQDKKSVPEQTVPAPAGSPYIKI